MHIEFFLTDSRMQSLLQGERSTWCAGTRIRLRRPGRISSRRREIKYSASHFYPSEHCHGWTARLIFSQMADSVVGDLRPHPGLVWDEEGVGVCRGLQEEIQDSQRAGNTASCCQTSLLSSANDDLIHFNLLRSIMQVPSWVNGMWTPKDLRRASLSTSSVSQNPGMRRGGKRWVENSYGTFF